MRRHARAVAAALAAAAALAHPPAAARAQPAAVDTAAMNALARMGAYLNTLDAFQVRAEITADDVLADGQKVQRTSTADLVADRPNRLRVSLEGDHPQRLILYDGRTFTLWAPRPRYYADAPAPPTIAELANVLEDRYAIDLPMADLFRWGTPEARVGEITSARVIGASQVDGVTCTHYAFRQAGLDWQVWIQKGAFPLPRRLVLTTLTDSARPQHATVFTWNLAPSYNDAAFAFVPPPDARRITLVEIGAARDVAISQ